MTETIDTAQPEALRLADLLFTAAAGSDAGIYTGTMRAAAAELRRLQNTLEMAVSDAQRSWRELAAAEAGNATLTDDAARYVWLTSHSDGDEQDDILQWLAATVVDKDRIDVTIDRARAAASISTKEGDTHAD